MSKKRRSRDWVFTLNNPGSDPRDDPQSWEGYRFMTWQKEHGSEGTTHLQGCVVWNTNIDLRQCKLRNPRAHWEIMYGTLDQSIRYCNKCCSNYKEPRHGSEGFECKHERESGPWTRGNIPQPGKRNDIHEVTDMIDSGASFREIALAYPVPFVKYTNGFKSYRMETAPDRSGEPNIIIIWGVSGCGKSRLAHDTFGNAYRKPKSEWWDGYHTQDTVVFDDFYSWIKYDELLRILDWYPLLVPIKNGYVRLVANTFVFTSNTDPMDWYRGGRDGRPERDRSALWRRFKEFGLVLKWDDCRRNGRWTKDYVVDLRFKQMQF